MGLFGKKKVAGFETYGDESSKKSYLKESLKSVGAGAKKVGNFLVPPKSSEQIAFEKELREKTQEAHRKAYLKEAVKQSQAKAKAMAKGKYNPIQTNSFDAIAGVGVPKSDKKKKDDLQDLLWRL